MRYKLNGFPILGESVQMGDVYAGAALGAFGVGVVNAVDGFASGKINELLGSYASIVKPMLGAVALSTAAWMLQKNRNPARAKGHVAGIVAVGLSKSLAGAISQFAPQSLVGQPGLVHNLLSFSAPQTYFTPQMQPYMGAIVQSNSVPSLGAAPALSAVVASTPAVSSYDSDTNLARGYAMMGEASAVDGELF